MISFNPLLSLLATCPKFHQPNSPQYIYLYKIARDISESLFCENKECSDEWKKIGKFKLPYFDMGSINSSHLFGVDELIIFSYYIFNSNTYKNSLDIGANIGLHSLILSKLGIKTQSFEPDPLHMEKFKSNLKINKAESNVQTIEAAISDKEESLKFCRVKGNTTGSHLVGAKENPYGDLEYFTVKCKSINEYFNNVDLIKLDAEGHEDIILCSLDINSWLNQDIFVEVGSSSNAQKIFNHFHGSKINLFSQKIGWEKVELISDMPTSYKEGSLFLSRKNEMNWDI